MIQRITGAVVPKLANPAKSAAKKTAASIAGVTGLAVLSGASGGSADQFASVPPIGVEIHHTPNVVDDGLIEALKYDLTQTFDIMGIPDTVEAVKEVAAERLERIKDGIAAWGDQVVDAVSDVL